MSGYRYGYQPAPARRLRTFLLNTAIVVVIAGISAVSGAAVILELVAPPQTDTAQATSKTTVGSTAVSNEKPHPNSQSISPARGVIASAPAAPEHGNVPAGPPQVAQSMQAPQKAPPSQNAPAPQAEQNDAATTGAIPATSLAAGGQPAGAVDLSPGELTFSKGYAKRRQAREATLRAAGVEPAKDAAKETAKDAKESKEANAAPASKPSRKSTHTARRRSNDVAYAQVYELPDGRRVTVYRDRYDRSDHYDRRDRYGYERRDYERRDYGNGGFGPWRQTRRDSGFFGGGNLF
jgi:hypothetical protein